jgi:protein-S-isoprenylcysteine O-methyltransferase Ste14
MFWFLIPLFFGFTSNLASAFTATFSEKFGKTEGTIITILLRDILGIPVWAIGFVMAISESSHLLYEVSLIPKITGWLIIAAGGILIVNALVTIRTKAAAPSTGDTLVKKGIYSRIRHPIHTGTFLEFAGLVILWPSLQVGIACVLGIVWIYLQSRFEEKDLIKRIPEYREYKSKVPAFVPKFRKKQPYSLIS